jgi:hypothetical protein
MVEVISKDEVVPVYGTLGRDVEGNAVGILVLCVCGEGEIGGCAGRGVRQAAVVLTFVNLVAERRESRDELVCGR